MKYLSTLEVKSMSAVKKPYWETSSEDTKINDQIPLCHNPQREYSQSSEQICNSRARLAPHETLLTQ